MLAKQLVVVALMLLLTQVWWCTHACWEDERLALLQLQNSFNAVSDQDRSVMINYKGSPWGKSANCCEWRGIQCDTHTARVTSLELQARFLGDWYLNASLFLPFKHLNYLDLGFNRIIGCLQNEGFERLKSLNNLEYLDLSYNKFTNNILSSLSGFSSLKSLNISYNNLKGLIYSEELAALRYLEELSLSGNKGISGFVASKDSTAPISVNTLYLEDMTTNEIHPLLKSLKVLPYLKTFFLGRNNLTKSSFHNESQSFKKLENLNVDGSIVDGDFFRSFDAPSLKSLSYREAYKWNNLQDFCNLNHLQSLDLSFNHFIGELPQCLANFTSLQYLDLSGNSLVGNLSSSPLTQMTSIQRLDLMDNNFQIPISLLPFYNFSNLYDLIIMGNELYAEIELHDLIPKFQLEELDMFGDGCGGFIPKFLYHQHNLQSVFLWGIEMQGEFPYWLLENNTKLQQLHLSNNSLSGSIILPSRPHMNLRGLTISSNVFSGQIPTKIGSHFPSLEYLFMSNNKLTGNIPSSIGNLRSLSYVDLSNNELNGSIPYSIGNLRSLRHLNLSDNEFNGNIPSSIGNLMRLFELDLSNNKLFGEVPQSLTMNCLELWTLKLSNNSLKGHVFSNNMSLKELRRIEVGGNQFIGTIPDSLYNCTWLQILDFSNNHLFGEIPSWIGSMEFLEMLDISGNNISGNLPIFVGTLSLTEVYLSKNMIHGSFLHAFYNCAQLKTLDLSHNFLTDNLSRWPGNFPQLSFLLLGHNKLEGEIIMEMCLLDQLSLIDLSNNNLSGHIPTCLMDKNWSRQHRKVSHSPNLVQGPSIAIASPPPPPVQPHQRPVVITTKNISLSYKGRILALISGIDLSCNNLTGQIPLELGSLNHIHMLNLSHNKLTGPIPPTLSNLEQIESLDLSYNNLEGNIPTQLTNLPFLSSFSVAHNNLSGRTPERVKQFGTFENGSYVGNPFLCGEPLSRSCTPKPLLAPPVPTTINEKEHGYIDMGTFYVSFTVTYTIVLSGIAAVLYINPYWRRAWFYFIEKKMEDCYYFIVYDCPRFIGSKLRKKDP